MRADDIQHKMEWEGFWYFFNDYISVDEIEDDEIRRAAEEFRGAGRKLRRLVDKKAREYDED